MEERHKVKRNKIYYGVTLDPDIAERGKEIAKANDRSFSWYVNYALEQALIQLDEED
ncbi:MAG: toxin-antitoxin system protein [Bacteroidetes bacterium 4572_77]|nr:MAG: toxin-antitoxin system protein [Bacteroidetes bacterium 4572_77]